MEPVRVKFYGVFFITKRTYLALQCLAVAIWLAILPICLGYAMELPDWFQPPTARACWALTGIAELIELWIMISRFDRRERRIRARALPDAPPL